MLTGFPHILGNYILIQSLSRPFNNVLCQFFIINLLILRLDFIIINPQRIYKRNLLNLLVRKRDESGLSELIEV